MAQWDSLMPSETWRFASDFYFRGFSHLSGAAVQDLGTRGLKNMENSPAGQVSASHSLLSQLFLVNWRDFRSVVQV